MGEGQPIIGARVRKIAGVEAHPPFIAPVDPALEMCDRIFVAVDSLSVEIRIAGVQVETVFPGNERKRLVKVLPELRDRAGFPRIVPCGLNAAAREAGIGFLKAPDIIALPAVQRSGNRLQCCECGFRVHAEGGILLDGGGVGG